MLDFIKKTIESETGAMVTVQEVLTSQRLGYKVWFTDLGEHHGLIAMVTPVGLRGYGVTFGAGKNAGEFLRAIDGADEDQVSLARAVVDSMRSDIGLTLTSPAGSYSNPMIGIVNAKATLKTSSKSLDEALVIALQDIVAPLMTAVTELIGYEVIETDDDEEHAVEGASYEAVILKRERSRRNRRLCILIHGHRCFCCGLDPRTVYGVQCEVIEVHHLQPLAFVTAPTKYDPAKDLVPLCPNCHRAVHSRRPVPFTPEELQGILKSAKSLSEES